MDIEPNTLLLVTVSLQIYMVETDGEGESLSAFRLSGLADLLNPMISTSAIILESSGDLSAKRSQNVASRMLEVNLPRSYR